MGATETTETEEVQVVEETEKITCNFDNEIACKIFEKGIEKGLTREQAVWLLLLALTKLVGGNQTYSKIVITLVVYVVQKVFILTILFEEGLEAIVNLLQNGYFGKGLDTIEKNRC